MRYMTYQAINARFARFLRARLLLASEGCLPAVSVITARFNQCENGLRPVSSETVRRWLRGLSLPELSRLPALCRLLGCSPIDIADHLGFEEMPTVQAPETSPDEADASAREPDALLAHVVEIMRGMDEPRLRAMVALFERREQKCLPKRMGSF